MDNETIKRCRRNRLPVRYGGAIYYIAYIIDKDKERRHGAESEIILGLRRESGRGVIFARPSDVEEVDAP